MFSLIKMPSSLKPYILIVALVLPVGAIVIGGRYLEDCPAAPLVPVYLIVRGVISIVLHLLNVVGGFPDVGEMVSPCHDTKTKIFMSLNGVSLIWFTIGCFWVYRAYEPSFERQDGEEYCHPTVYHFCFWTVNLSFIVLFVYFALIAICLSRRAREAKEMLSALAGGTSNLPVCTLKEKGSAEEKVAMVHTLDYVHVVDLKSAEGEKVHHSLTFASVFK